jgi:hypothetical protein
MKIVEVIPKEDFTLLVKADDGSMGIFDVKPYLDSDAFAPLKNHGEFEQVNHGGYFVEWNCGADLSVDTIEARWKTLPSASLVRKIG